MNKKILGVFLFAVFTMSSVWAQGRKGLRINEVLVTNETNYQESQKVSYSQRRCTYRNASSSAFAVLGR